MKDDCAIHAVAARLHLRRAQAPMEGHEKKGAARAVHGMDTRCASSISAAVFHIETSAFYRRDPVHDIVNV